MRARHLSVPLNREGKREYEYGVEHSENLIDYLLPEEEFDALWSGGVFAGINERCDLMIDDYESEVVSAANLEKCMELLERYPGVFLTAAVQAVEKGTFLALDF